jgi:hypothetical protein
LLPPGCGAQHQAGGGVNSKIALLSMIVSVRVNAPTRTGIRSLSQDCGWEIS